MFPSLLITTEICKFRLYKQGQLEGNSVLDPSFDAVSKVFLLLVFIILILHIFSPLSAEHGEIQTPFFKQKVFMKKTKSENKKPLPY